MANIICIDHRGYHRNIHVWCFLCVYENQSKFSAYTTNPHLMLVLSCGFLCNLMCPIMNAHTVCMTLNQIIDSQSEVSL